MFYTVNHSLQSLHTVRPGSKFEQALTDKDIKKERFVMMIGDDRHSVFRAAELAREWRDFLEAFGGQH